MVQDEIEVPDSVTAIKVKDTRSSLSTIARNFFGNPGKSIKIVGVTGTNGKTTTCYLIDSILRKVGVPSSIITTVDSHILDRNVKFDRTTPDALQLNRFFSQSIEEGARFACMEISSHSVDLHRVDYVEYDGFVFTNLSQDHLDYHGSMKNYFESKRKLFDGEYRGIYGGSFAVVNMDDDYGKIILGSTDLQTTSFSVYRKDADLYVQDMKSDIKGIDFGLCAEGGCRKVIRSPLCGRFNIYNILAAIGVCRNLGIPFSYIQEGISSMAGVKGRFEKITIDGGFTVIVDYAHTPDGLENVLVTAKGLLNKGGRLITVFGCGGDRDKQKRKIMGSISAKYSSVSIITSDNPRSEDPEDIMEMIAQGFCSKNEYLKITDRKKAIEYALVMARVNDIIIIAGKGHEDYQEFAGRRIHFSDQETVREIAGRKHGRS